MYYSLNQYLKDTFGEKVYKIALDGGFTCPNRDGTLGTGGCIFCSGAGAGEFAQNRGLSITQQLVQGKALLSKKIKDGKYIAYFQAFTNTYGPVERLRQLYEEALAPEDIVALSVATRPDCLPQEVVELLAELNRKKPVWVELGLQTMHERTADYIRRGYPLRVYEDAVCRLKAAGLTVITHVILGLPYETEQEMKQTVSYVGQSGVDGIKLQLLHVIRGTDLEREYLSGKFEVLTMEAYVKLVADCLELIPPQMVVHRLTGDGDKRTLVAPMWSADKKRVLNALNAELRKRESLT
ncbi:MAG: TIGR01212 family radical SAM protein [Agathobacter sp.]|nr:TIGR01212 family radical SAM protein [Agathobacter sp.]